jgi:predicted DNA-binding transcriptional regulator AlpA
MQTLQPRMTGRGPRRKTAPRAAGIGHNLGPPLTPLPKPEPEPRPKRLLPTRAVMERYQVSDRSIDRWVADPDLGFPKPIRINRKRFFYEHELDAFDATRR